MEEHTRDWWVIVFGIAIIILAIIILLSFVVMSAFTPVKFKMKCDIGEITYVDMTNTNSRCYGSFSREFCPLPGRINCEVEGEAPIFLLEKLR
jgi:hypothetical protein